MNNVLAMILAGGEGDRLSVLSQQRAKPAVPFAGRYRLIDFALSNCANSGINRIGILTQFRPHSLNEHIRTGRAWDLDRRDSELVLLQPYLSRKPSGWYKGTADAIYQNLDFIARSRADHILVLAGDHIYLMDYRPMLQFHLEQQADVTVGMHELPISEAHRFGILSTDYDDRIIAFEEKSPRPTSGLASMGIYLFRREVLMKRVVEDAERDGQHDFGRNVLPEMVRHGERVWGYRFDGYWRDVGTLDSLWQANMDLLEDYPVLDLYDARGPVRTSARDLAPAKIGATGRVERSLLSDGCMVNGHVERSVISPGVQIERGAVVRDSVIFDDCLIERGAVVQHAILDKEVHIGGDARVGSTDDFTYNRLRPDLLHSGLTVVGKRATLTPRLQVGRNCIIGPVVSPRDLPPGYVPSGTTVMAPSADPRELQLAEARGLEAVRAAAAVSSDRPQRRH